MDLCFEIKTVCRITKQIHRISLFGHVVILPTLFLPLIRTNKIMSLLNIDVAPILDDSKEIAILEANSRPVVIKKTQEKVTVRGNQTTYYGPCYNISGNLNMTLVAETPQIPDQLLSNSKNLMFKSLLLENAIEYFHVTSYEANCASHHTRDVHVGFLYLQSGIGKPNKMSKNFSFISYHNTKLQLSDKNISTHTRVNFKILLRSKSKITVCFDVFLHTTLYKKEIDELDKIVRIQCVLRPRRLQY